MKTFYKIENEVLKQTTDKNANIIVYTTPDEQEKLALIEKYELDQADIDSIFDPDEVPRMEYENGRLFIIWKTPDNASVTDIVEFEVSSIGLIYTKDEVVLIIPKENFSFGGKEFKKITTTFGFLLRVVLSTIRHYQSHLKAIKLIANEIETKLVVSMENKYLLQMFTIGESLIYYHNALEGNSTILVKLRYIAEKLKLNEDEIEYLEDVSIENQQAVKQASIYSSILSGLMDARGTIINNNMNILLKNLTVINVVFLPLNLIASIGGMSEFSAMTKDIDWRISYSLFCLAMVIIGLITWYILDKLQNTGKKM